MNDYATRQQESGGTTASTDTPMVPDSAALIGTDAEGATHYLGNRITADGIPVFVEGGDGIETFDLSETPCTQADDVVEAWIDHVERKRGEWERIVYNQPLAVTLVESLGGES